MQKNQIIRKGLSVLIILIFIGVAILPSITADNNQKTSVKKIDTLTGENKLSCCYFTLHGIEKIEKEISPQESNRLLTLMDSSNIDAIANELYKLDLIPLSINIEQVKDLISGEYGKKNFEKYTDKFNNKILAGSNVKQNLFCILNGDAADYHSRDLKTQIFAMSTIPPGLLLFLLDILLQHFSWYPIIYSFYIWPYITFHFGILAIPTAILLGIGLIGTDILDYSPLKMSVIQFVFMGDAHLNTSGFLGKWSLSNKSIDLSMIGFMGLCVFTDDHQNDFTAKFRGFSLYLKADAQN